jgi:hypothetical protein
MSQSNFSLENDMESDKELIARLGGPTTVAELLGYNKHGGVQRVQNWITRGIPAKVKLANPSIFQTQHRRATDVIPKEGRQGRQPPHTNNIFDTVPHSTVIAQTERAGEDEE